MINPQEDRDQKRAELQKELEQRYGLFITINELGEVLRIKPRSLSQAMSRGKNGTAFGKRLRASAERPEGSRGWLWHVREVAGLVVHS